MTTTTRNGIDESSVSLCHDAVSWRGQLWGLPQVARLWSSQGSRLANGWAVIVSQFNNLLKRATYSSLMTRILHCYSCEIVFLYELRYLTSLLPAYFLC